MLRAAVKHGVEAGLSNALKNLKPDVGPAIRLSVVQEAVDAGVKAALKDANMSVEPLWPVLGEDQKATKMAVKLGIFEALKEMQQSRSGREPLQEFVEDQKLADAMDNFNDTMKEFILVYKNMFTAEDGEEGTESGKFDGTKATKDGGLGAQSGGESDGGKFDGSKTTKDGVEVLSRGETKGGEYGSKTRKELNKFDVFLKKYNEDHLETVRVLKELLQNSEAVKQHQMKSKDFVADWCNETADTCLGKVRMEKLRKVMTLFPYIGKGYFYYLILKMMGESEIPPWHYPMVVRATRLLIVKQALDIYNEAKNPKKPEEKKPEEKSEEKNDDGPKPE